MAVFVKYLLLPFCWLRRSARSVMLLLAWWSSSAAVWHHPIAAFTTMVPASGNDRSRALSSLRLFRNFVRPRIKLSASSKSSEHDDDDKNFMASLQERVNQINDSQLPLVVLNDTAILPRQVLEWTVTMDDDPVLWELALTRWAAETPSFGVVGRRRRSSPTTSSSGGTIYSSGVEVEMMERPASAQPPGGGCFQLKLRGTRIFRIQSAQLDEAVQGWKQAPVEFVDLEAEEAAEDVFQMAISLQRAREFATPNGSMNEDKSLVDMWIELARTKEITPGQIDRLLHDLGPMPSWKQPSEIALWIGALINPEPALGVAWEIRPQLLLAKTAEERTQIALDGIWNSIQHMEAADKRYRQIKE